MFDGYSRGSFYWGRNGLFHCFESRSRVALTEKRILKFTLKNPTLLFVLSLLAMLSKQSSAQESADSVTIEDVRLELVPIPTESFTMGSPDDEGGRYSDEGPQTKVFITQRFWLGKTEVTQRQWEAIMGNNPSKFKGENRPVEKVTWDGVMEFCRILTERERQAGRLSDGLEYTLPTEAQWEYACRAGTTTRFSYGDDPEYSQLGNYAWYAENSGRLTHDVGGKLPDPWGLYDMHGNVSELVFDWGSTYAGGNVADPRGPSLGTLRVNRGGAISLSSGRGCRSAYRSKRGPDVIDLNLGFRVALVPVSLNRNVVTEFIANVDLDGRRSDNRKNLQLAAGCYRVHAQTRATNFWGFVGRCDQNDRCRFGWLVRYNILSSEFETIARGSGTWETLGQALANAPDATFSLSREGQVGFYIPDFPYSDNEGGLMLKVSLMT